MSKEFGLSSYEWICDVTHDGCVGQLAEDELGSEKALQSFISVPSLGDCTRVKSGTREEEFRIPFQAVIWHDQTSMPLVVYADARFAIS